MAEKHPHPGGRPPSPAPKRHDLKVRVNDQMFDQLTDYSVRHHMPMAEIIRRAIDKLLSDQQ